MHDRKEDPSQVDDLKEDIKDIKQVIFGDGEERKGLVGRLSRIEDRLALFWASLGVVWSFVIVLITNFISSYFKH